MRKPAARQRGAVTWPQLVAVIVVIAFALWLYRRHQVNEAYGRTIVAQSISLAMGGRTAVEAAVMSYGALPKSADEVEMAPTDQPYGPPDRVVRLRLDVLDRGVLQVRYDGWKFNGATLRLIPSIQSDTLKWKCSTEGIPDAWVHDWCFQIEERGTRLGAPPEPLPGAGTSAANEGGAGTTPGAEDEASGLWEAPFRTRGRLTGESSVISQGLQALEPFQRAVEIYAAGHDRSFPNAADIEKNYTPAQLQLPLGDQTAQAHFGPAGSIYLEFKWLHDGITVEVTPTHSENRLLWQCRAFGEGVDLPDECKPH